MIAIADTETPSAETAANLDVAEDEDVINLAEVEMRDVDWIWEDWIPFGKLTLLAGDTGSGKSLITLDVATSFTTGRELPDGSPPGREGSVLLVLAEDDLEDTVKPRLEALGADVSRVIEWRTTRDNRPGTARPIFFPADAEALAAKIERHGARLVIIDPLASFLGVKINSWNDAGLRQALMPLVKVARKTGAAIVLVAHLNKKEPAKAIYRIGGSIAQVSAARSVLVVAEDSTNSEDPNGERRYVLACVKSNLAMLPPPLSYHIEEVKVQGVEKKVPRVRFDGLADISIEEAMQPDLQRPVRRAPRPKKESKAQLAREFLSKRLTDGPVPVAVLRREADEVGIDWFTLKNAKEDLGVQSVRVDGPAWRLPEK